MSAGGFYKRRRGILEHLEAGRISLLDLAVHDLICLKANGIVASPSLHPPGVWMGSAAAIYALCPKNISSRAVRRSLDHLEKLGWIKRWKTTGRHGNYPILIARFSVHSLSGSEYLVNAEKTTDWQSPFLVRVHELSGDRRVADHLPPPIRELRIDSREKREEEGLRPKIARANKPLSPLAFNGRNFQITETQHCNLGGPIITRNRQKTYREIDGWLDENPERLTKDVVGFVKFWMRHGGPPQRRPGYDYHRKQKEFREQSATEVAVMN